MKKLSIVIIIFLFLTIFSSSQYTQLFIEQAIKNYKIYDDEIFFKISQLYSLEGNFENFWGSVKNIKNYDLRILLFKESFFENLSKDNFDFLYSFLDNVDDSLKSKYYFELFKKFKVKYNIYEAKKYLALSEKNLPSVYSNFEKMVLKISIGEGFGELNETAKAISILNSTFWQISFMKKNTDKKILFLFLYEAYRKLNLKINSKITFMQFEFEKDPELLLLLSKKFLQLGDSLNTKKFLNLAYINSKIDDDKKRGWMLSEIANMYNVLNDKSMLKKVSVDCIKTGKGLSSRIERVNIILSVLKYVKDENLEKFIAGDISFVKDDKTRIDLYLKFIETFFQKNEKEKGFVFLKIILKELKYLNVKNRSYFLNLISEMYSSYGNREECETFIKLVKREHKKFVHIVAKMYIYNGDFSKSIRSLGTIKDDDEKFVILNLMQREGFRVNDKELHNLLIKENLIRIEKIKDNRLKSILLLDLAFNILKYQIYIDNKSLSILETI